jgi:hypothetical protein
MRTQSTHDFDFVLVGLTFNVQLLVHSILKLLKDWFRLCSESVCVGGVCIGVQ